MHLVVAHLKMVASVVRHVVRPMQTVVGAGCVWAEVAAVASVVVVECSALGSSPAAMMALHGPEAVVLGRA